MLGKVRGLDLFAVPVSLSYKGKTKFNTLCGGCFSLVFILSFLTYAGLTLRELIVDPVLKNYAEKRYFSYADNTNSYEIDTKDSTLGIYIEGNRKTNELLRVVF